jgi:hypothetical protein
MVIDTIALKEIVNKLPFVYVLAVVAEHTPSKNTLFEDINLNGVEVKALPGLILERFKKNSNLVVVDGLLSVLYSRYGLIKSADTSTKIVCTEKGMWIYEEIEKSYKNILLYSIPGELQIEST